MEQAGLEEKVRLEKNVQGGEEEREGFPDHRTSSSRAIQVGTGKSRETCVWGTELALICT